MQDNRLTHLVMSEIFANFALSQESDIISNFPGSVSQKLEIEKRRKFSFDASRAERLPMPYMRGLLSCILFVNWFPTTIYQKNARCSPRFLYEPGWYGLADHKNTSMITTLLLAAVIFGVLKLIMSLKNNGKKD